MIKWVSWLIHTYTTPEKRRLIKVIISNHQADSPLHVWSDLVICKFRKSVVIHDTKCPYWDQASLNNKNQTKYMYPCTLGGDKVSVNDPCIPTRTTEEETRWHQTTQTQISPWARWITTLVSEHSDAVSFLGRTAHFLQLLPVKTIHRVPITTAWKPTGNNKIFDFLLVPCGLPYYWVNTSTLDLQWESSPRPLIVRDGCIVTLWMVVIMYHHGEWHGDIVTSMCEKETWYIMVHVRKYRVFFFFSNAYWNAFLAPENAKKCC